MRQVTRSSIPAVLRSSLFLFSVLLCSNHAVGDETPSPIQFAAEVDRQLQRELPGTKLQPAADDVTLLRRLFFDLVGQPPTPDDVLAFLADSDSEKVNRVIEQLLGDSQYGMNWARYWRDVILYRKAEPRAAFVEPSLEEFLADSLNESRGWDAIAREFVVAKGDVKEIGATAIIMAQGGMPEDTVAELSRIFCGIQIQCAQCHDHPTDQWTREQFHQLAAFFPRVAVRPTRDGEQRSFLVSVTDQIYRSSRRGPVNNRFRGTLEHRMPDLENPTAEGELMTPAFFVDRQSVDRGALDVERRGALAKWMTSPENPWFARAYVNRMWSELIGHGFYEPVDDLGPEKEVRCGETLELLSGGFKRSGFDAKWLIRTITATQVYRQQSTALSDCTQCTPAVVSPQRLRADQLFDALEVTLNVDLDPARSSNGRPGNARFNVRRVFRSSFGYDPSERREEIVGSISQALAMMNSRLALQYSRSLSGSGISRVASSTADQKSAISELYLRTLSRLPNREETRTCLSYLQRAENRGEGFEDIQWALINSTEFLYRP